MIQFGRTYAIFRKEIFHILRDPFTLIMSIGIPIFMVFTFGFAIEFNTKYLHLGVFDADMSGSSRRFIETFGSSQYFIPSEVRSPRLGQISIEREDNRAALIIPRDFEQNLLSGRTTKVQILLDGSDNSTVGPITSYMGSIQSLASQKLTGFEIKNDLNIRSRFLFNPELNSQWFVIPGLTVVVMSILSILLTALTVAREWENGSMELLLSTPVRPLEIILGKLTPYGIMALISLSFLHGIARLVFKIPFEGNHLAYVSGAVLFLITYLAQGLVISVTTRKQQIAMQFAMMSGMIPSQLLSGFIFPIESMPKFFQYFTMIFPARWYMVVARNSYLKGSTFVELGSAFLGLGILATVMVTLATRLFKRDLEP